ncbi:hypothetical protein [Halalkalibacillus halophilus]|uniref:hypothetical protein n=1 Tax=Halalkalibacillus halophilus TaxID=392827 RepID=UPI0004191692|nr:hypothetical protein [Halalkalibacillus halophilus]
MNNLNVQHYTNEHQYKVTQMTENIEKQTALVQVTDFENKDSENLGFVKIKRGKELKYEDYIKDQSDIEEKSQEINELEWINDKMKNEIQMIIKKIGTNKK